MYLPYWLICLEEQHFSYAGLPCVKPKCGAGKKLIPTEIETLNGCPYYKCLAEEDSIHCTKPECPEGYTAIRLNDRAARLQNADPQVVQDNLPLIRSKRYILSDEQCPRYECVPADTETPEAEPLKMRKKCALEGTTIKTFDSVSFINELCYAEVFRSHDENMSIKCKYEILKFVYFFNNFLYILDKKNCTGQTCNGYLILEISGEVILLRTDMRIEYKNNVYSGDEAARFAESKPFSIHSVGDSIFLKLKSDKVYVEWQSNGAFSILVSNF